jgi:hypothetical protein
MKLHGVFFVRKNPCFLYLCLIFPILTVVNFLLFSYKNNK